VRGALTVETDAACKSGRDGAEYSNICLCLGGIEFIIGVVVMLVSRNFDDVEIEQLGLNGKVRAESEVAFGDRVGVILIHGRAGDENVMWVFSRAIEDLDPIVIAPRGLVPDPIGGYSWWNLHHDPNTEESPSPSHSKLAQVKPAIDKIIEAAKKMPEMYGVDPNKIFVLGFSQGGAVSISCAMEHPQMFRGVGMLASFVPSVIKEKYADCDLSGLNVFISHGTKDRIIPIERAKEGLDFLTERGANVAYNEDEVGHKISSAGIKSFKNWLMERA